MIETEVAITHAQLIVPCQSNQIKLTLQSYWTFWIVATIFV